MAITAIPPENHPSEFRDSEAFGNKETRRMDMKWALDAWKKSGITQVAIGIALGIPPDMVNKMLHGKRQPKADELPKLEKVLGAKAPQSGIGLEFDNDQRHARRTTFVNSDLFTKDIPVYRLAPGGISENIPFEYNTGEVVDSVRRTPRLNAVPSSYGLFIEGDSMSPWRYPGEIVVIHPGQPCNIGDYVVVTLRPISRDDAGEPVLIKKLIKRTEKDLTLLQHNPEKEIRVPAARVKSIHKVMSSTEILTA